MFSRPHTTEDAAELRRAAGSMCEPLAGWFGEGFAVEARVVDSGFDLLPAERALIAGAAPGRIAEFATGRACARQALRRVGAPPIAVGVGALRQPIAPAGYLTSISHDGGLAVAVACPATRALGLGLDIFDARRSLAVDLERHIAAPDELSAWRACIGDDAFRQILFACKEAAVKVLSARAGRFLRLPELALAPDGQAFSLIDGSRRLKGRWWRVGGFFVTAAVETSPGGAR